MTDNRGESGHAVAAPYAPADPGRITIRNEFAYVSVQLRNPGGRPRLRVEDLRTGQSIELDAIELECLAWARHSDLAPLLDPSLTRWASADTRSTTALPHHRRK